MFAVDPSKWKRRHHVGAEQQIMPLRIDLCIERASPKGLAMRSRLFALVMFISAALLPAGQAAAQSRGNSANAHEAHKKDKVENGNQENGSRPIYVPEPATIVLLGAAAGVVGVRKVWQQRRRLSKGTATKSSSL